MFIPAQAVLSAVEVLLSEHARVLAREVPLEGSGPTCVAFTFLSESLLINEYCQCRTGSNSCCTTFLPRVSSLILYPLTLANI